MENSDNNNKNYTHIPNLSAPEIFIIDFSHIINGNITIKLNNYITQYLLNFPIKLFFNNYYLDIKFIGIIIDSGAVSRSIVGYNQFRVFQCLIYTELNPISRLKINFIFGIGNTTTIDTATI